MGLLTPVGVTITPQRSTTVFGEDTWVAITPISNAVFVLSTPSASVGNIGSTKDRLYAQGGSLFVPRGSDLKDGDRVTFQGKTFGVVGDAQWDMDHPFTGDDFGYVEYAIRLGG